MKAAITNSFEDFRRKIESQLQPDARELTNEELAAAAISKISVFPEVIRRFNDPPDYSKFCLVSFMVSENLSLIKIRGFGTKDELLHMSKDILKYDSRTKLVICELGKWLPVVDDAVQFCKDNKTLIDDILVDQERRDRDEENRIASPPKPDKMDLDENLRKIMCLYETDCQIIFLNRKRTLLEERKRLLANIIQKIPDDFRKNWWKLYLSRSKELGIAVSLKEERIEEELQTFDETTTLEEDVRELERVTYEYSKLNFVDFLK